MRFWVSKKDLEYFEKMQDEGRTRHIPVYTYKFFDDDRELELETK